MTAVTIQEVPYADFLLAKLEDGLPMNLALVEWMEHVGGIAEALGRFDVDAVAQLRDECIAAFTATKRWSDAWQERHDAIEKLLSAGLSITQAVSYLAPHVTVEHVVTALLGSSAAPYAEQYAQLDDDLIAGADLTAYNGCRAIANAYSLPAQNPVGVRRMLVMRNQEVEAPKARTVWSEQLVDDAMRLRGVHGNSLVAIRAALVTQHQLDPETFTKQSVVSLLRRGERRGRDARAAQGRPKWSAQ